MDIGYPHKNEHGNQIQDRSLIFVCTPR